MIKPIECHDSEQHTNAIAAYLPNGPLFAAKIKAGTVFRQLLTGIAEEVLNAEAYLKELQDDFIPDTTVKFIEEWESVLGIPDDCFLATGDTDERRRDILIKLASLGVQTADDFVALAALFGIVVTVESGKAVNQPPAASDKEQRFTIVVTFTVEAANQFPLTFPFTFGDEVIAIVECLFSKLKPANCNVLFIQV